MLKSNIEEQCRKISPAAVGSKSECAFAPRGGVIGFIDTSSVRDGSRGIAFFGDRMYVNTDGAPHEIEYKKIGGLQIISSFEDQFADELSVSGDGFELRISDYSLDKFELKRLLDELCREREQVVERRTEQAEKYAEIIARKLDEELSEERDFDDRSPVITETFIEIPENRAPLPEDYAPAPIPDERINWISGKGGGINSSLDTIPKAEAIPKPAAPKQSEPPKQLEVMSGVVDRVPVIGTIKPSDPQKLREAQAAVEQAPLIPEKKPLETNLVEEAPREAPKPQKDPLKAFEKEAQPSEKEMRERIENMGADEMMMFLSSTLNEINDQSAPFFDQTDEPKAEYAQSDPPPNAVLFGTVEEPKITQTDSVFINDAAESAKPGKWDTLTKEPVWGDIYIRASKSLRELCESGRLTMEQMENEIKARLLSAAEEFEKITGDEKRVPKVLLPKITELKSAAADIDKYFDYGEDVAVRAMFFMMYQMLSYSDRIMETPETKDKLNDFFRRFGPAGITLSMLDMRV